MKSCDDCPGSIKCSSVHLHPILVEVFDLYANGMHDKFDILFSLSDEDEEALELCDAQVSRDCWTKAALLAIAEVVGRIGQENMLCDDAEEQAFATIKVARDAFEHFPWHLEGLVEQAPDLYALIQEQCSNPALCDRISKRAFVKACKDIVFTR